MTLLIKSASTSALSKTVGGNRRSSDRRISTTESIPPSGGAAAAARLSARVDPARIRRHWLLERWQETPSWLTSLVFHMTLVIVLGSLTLGALQNRDRALPLLLTVAEAPGRPETEPEVIIHPQPVDEGLHDGPNDLAPQVQETVPEQAIPFDPLDAKTADVDELGVQDEPPVIRDAARAATSVLLADVAGVVRPGRAAQSNTQDTEPRKHQLDEVVQRFIEYDIGRLRGEEGQAARRAFSQLGDDAIPALVRGLNRSAYLSASCPVVVISRKLTKSLENTSDPQSLQYAVDHLGEDVPSSAPHAGVLRGVRAKALEIQAMRQRYQDVLDAGRNLTWEEYKQLEKLAEQKPVDLAGVLRSSDPRARLAAVVAIGLKASRLADRTRLQLGRDVSELLDDPNPRIRKEAVFALTRLAPDAAGAMQADDDPRTTARWWRSYWRQFEKERVAANAAENQFRMAQSLAGAGKLEVAKRRYRQLRQQYPDTQAAAAATRELQRLGEL